ncbi:MAG: hypothetical protein F4201_11595 [Nitrospira sp. SB0677_bin_15]|nr:hypothetical protein [Nitrospira sp. SB0667_bin_9]MYD30791.1 hypothetical protein [Nitrospira sp. SB0661_bin_20]MYG41425.1 hypothetical protein [Nitrospira sp. SB0677_bin_15]MYH01928.1 hypothetical protein [Nitrospira sp. SB0675_bin_23]MYJ22766.1 hypothetical protein [Nitrospira sp. SB0673_bin_12]
MDMLLTKRLLTFDAPLMWRIQPGECGQALAVCDQLDMSIQIDAGTPAQQDQQIAEALTLLYDDLNDSGELEQFFAHYGIKVTIRDSILKPSEISVAALDVSQPTAEVGT